MAKAKAKAKAPKAKAPEPPKPPTLFLVTGPDEMFRKTQLRAGMFESGSKEDLAYEPDDIAYYRLTTSHADYLEPDRLWPITTNDSSKLVRDDMWGGWKFKLVELGPPMLLDAPATWQRLLDAGLSPKGKKKTHPSVLEWPALKGHTEVLRLLLDAGVKSKGDELIASAGFGQLEASRFLVERGFDGNEAARVYQRYNNKNALDLLAKLGFKPPAK